MNHRLSQRQVAEAIGVLETTYANAESSTTRRLRSERVERLAKFYALDDAATAELVAGWNAMPESDYNRRNAKSWAQRDARRSKLKNHDPLCVGLIKVLTLLITNVPTAGALCTCEFGEDAPCDLCDPLRLLGIAGWTRTDDVIAKLAAAQEKFEKSPNTGKAP